MPETGLPHEASHALIDRVCDVPGDVVVEVDAYRSLSPGCRQEQLRLRRARLTLVLPNFGRKPLGRPKPSE
jgi:hypothetical protein